MWTTILLGRPQRKLQGVLCKQLIGSNYADEDVFCDNPVGTEVYNSGKEHLVDFIAWCNYMEKDGYEIKFEA